jgi:hypothetical protein
MRRVLRECEPTRRGVSAPVGYPGDHEHRPLAGSAALSGAFAATVQLG